MSERSFKPVETDLTFISPAKLAKDGMTGIVLEGQFVEAIPNNYDPEKNDFKFLLDDGTTKIINNCGSLTYQMQSVEPGTIVQIEYNGKIILESGKNKGKESHDFTVLVEESSGDTVAG